MSSLSMRFWIMLLLLGSLGGCVYAEPVRYRAPPAPIVERIPPPPSAVYVWRPGHWRWNGFRYAWVPGHYIARPV